MNRIYLGAIAAALTFSAATPVFAQTNAATTTRPKAKIETVKEKTAEARAKALENRKERIRSFAIRAAERLTRVLEREENFITRLDAHMRKAEEKKRDVTQAKARLAEAKASLESAKTQVAALGADAEKALAGTNANEIFKSVRTLVKSAHDATVTTHQKVVTVLRELKGERPVTATSTPSATTTSAQ